MRIPRLAHAAALSSALLVAACGGGAPAEPGGLSEGEARELNDAAAMLDANAVDLNAVTTEGQAR